MKPLPPARLQEELEHESSDSAVRICVIFKAVGKSYARSFAI
jgi:hypothetical protein